MIRLERSFFSRASQVNEFWEVEIIGNEPYYYLRRRKGRIGTNGQAMTHHFYSRMSVEQKLEQLVRQKLGSGYHNASNNLLLTLTERCILRRCNVGFNSFESDEPIESAIREGLQVNTELTKRKIIEQNNLYRKKTNRKLTLRELLS